MNATIRVVNNKKNIADNKILSNELKCNFGNFNLGEKQKRIVARNKYERNTAISIR